MKCGPAQGKTRRRPSQAVGRGGIEAVPTLQGGLGRRMVGEHLNEATISRLGSILAYIPHPHRAPLWVSSAVSYLPGP
jgi:hypothetical protein